jgi:RNA polymerase sigma-70 factor (ECF subfamily)
LLTESDGETETCWSLVTRAAAGDPPSCSRFGRTYLPLIRGFLAHRWRGTKWVEEIDDATQDVFVECFRPDGPLTHADAAKGDFRGYLFGVARNVALRAEAQARRRPTQDAPQSLADAADNDPSVSRVFDREWASMLMREAGQLMHQRATDDKSRLRVELLRLRFGRDLTMPEIATQLEMDLAALHRQYARAREEFRSCLRSVVAFHCVRTETPASTTSADDCSICSVDAGRSNNRRGF